MPLQCQTAPITSAEPERRLTDLARDLMSEFPELGAINWRVDWNCGDHTDYKCARFKSATKDPTP